MRSDTRHIKPATMAPGFTVSRNGGRTASEIRGPLHPARGTIRGGALLVALFAMATLIVVAVSR